MRDATGPRLRPLRPDTDAEWRELAASEPFWAVVTHEDFRVARLDETAVARFFEGGRADVAMLHGALQRARGAPERFSAALDFGCGVGRLLAPIAQLADRAAGVDVAPGMRALAVQRLAEQGCTNASVHETIAEAVCACGPFAWVNSFIVLQHIPPERGYDLISDLLGALEPGGFASLQLTCYREPHLHPQGVRAALQRAEGVLRGLLRLPARGTIRMYDYDLSRVYERFVQAGCGEIALVHTDHGGHHGAIILARKQDR